MPLHPQVEAIRAQRIATGEPPLYEMSIEEARAADLAAIQASAGTPEHVHDVRDVSAPRPGGSVPLRVYRPSGERGVPVLVYFFGGGWTLGSLETSDAVCRYVANRSGCAVVAAGYRLAPEHKFPAAVEDCFAVTAWVAANADELGVDGDRIAVGGDSAGGNLAAVVALLARERGPRLAFQLLVYPVTDYLPDTPSMREAEDPFLFNRRSIEWYWGHYLREPADAESPLAAPLREPDLTGLPPALVITAEHDPLRDEGEAYAHRLEEAGVDVELIRYDGMAHGFFTMIGAVDAARTALDRTAARLRELSHTHSTR